MPVSLIVTTKNEAAALDRLLDSIAAQSRPPDDIVIVDGGSTDATVALLQAAARRLPLRVVVQPGANISQGRNAAIRAARGDLICATDAGVALDPDWLAEIIRPLEQEGGDVVSGFFVPDPCGAFETALAATTLPALQDIHPAEFLPSSRSVAFRREAWARAGGYPEWLDYCEDLIFDFALRDAGCRFTFAPRALVRFRPREHLAAFFRQYYHYARGDGKANLWFKRHLVRYATYFLALPLLIALLVFFPPAAVLGGLAGAFGMFYTPYKRLLPMLAGLAGWERVEAIAWVPLIRITGDVAKMVGYPVGCVWRMRRGNLNKEARA